MKSAIFDLDGTLLNTIEDIGESMNAVLKRHSLKTHDISEYKIFVGNGARVLTERAIGPENAALTDTLLHEYKEEYAINLVNRTRAYEGVYSMLDRLVKDGVRIGIFTNKPHADMLVLKSKLFDMYEFFAAYGARDGVPLKPDPSVLLDMTKGIEGEKFFIGDTSVDVLTGKNAGFVTVGCEWGFRSKSELSGADFIAEKPDDVADHIIAYGNE